MVEKPTITTMAPQTRTAPPFQKLVTQSMKRATALPNVMIWATKMMARFARPKKAAAWPIVRALQEAGPAAWVGLTSRGLLAVRQAPGHRPAWAAPIPLIGGDSSESTQGSWLDRLCSTPMSLRTTRAGSAAKMRAP